MGESGIVRGTHDQTLYKAHMECGTRQVANPTTTLEGI